MVKRSARSRRTPPSSLPQAKHAKYDHAASGSQQSSKTRRETPGENFSKTLHLLPVRSNIDDKTVDIIYLNVTTYLRSHRAKDFDLNNLASLEQFNEQFKAEIGSWSNFLKVFRKAAREDASNDDREALLIHGVCL